MKKFILFAGFCTIVLRLAVSCVPDNVTGTLNAPIGLKAENVTPSTASLSWTAVEGAEKYNVLIDDAAPVEVFTSSYKAEDLTPETEYTWKVQAVKGGSGSEWSSTSSFTTPEAGAGPVSEPTGLEVGHITDTTVRLTWEQEGADYHEVVIDNGAAIPVTELFYDASGLTPETAYIWKVRSGKDGAWSEWAEGGTFTTDETGIEFLYALPDYWGAEYGFGTSNFFILFVTFDPFGKDFNGYELRMDIISPKANESQSQWYLDIPAGTYTFDFSKAKNTVCLQDENTLLRRVANGRYEESGRISGGTMTISGDHSKYTMKVEMSVADTTFVGYYKGSILLKNPYAPKSQFSEDQNLGTLPLYGGVEYYPDADGRGEIDGYVTQGVSDGVSIVDGYVKGTGWLLGAIQFQAPIDSSNTIPDGTYEIANSGAAGCVRAGSSNDVLGETYGLWARRLDNGAVKSAPIVSGMVRSTYSDGTYTIDVFGKDPAGNDIFATVTGSGASYARQKYGIDLKWPLESGTVTTRYSSSAYTIEIDARATGVGPITGTIQATPPM